MKTHIRNCLYSITQTRACVLGGGGGEVKFCAQKISLVSKQYVHGICHEQRKQVLRDWSASFIQMVLINRHIHCKIIKANP